MQQATSGDDFEIGFTIELIILVTSLCVNFCLYLVFHTWKTINKQQQPLE